MFAAMSLSKTISTQTFSMSRLVTSGGNNRRHLYSNSNHRKKNSPRRHHTSLENMSRRPRHQLPRLCPSGSDRSGLETRVAGVGKPDDIDRVGGDRGLVVDGEGQVERGGNGTDEGGEVVHGFGDG